MGFCCGPSDVKVLPNNTSSLSSTSSSSSSPAKDSADGGKKKQQQGVKKEQGREKKKSNLDRAAMATPRLPFHSRPGGNLSSNYYEPNAGWKPQHDIDMVLGLRRRLQLGLD
ncbi:unnamed protein product [Triticum turgidum subsp. durum]|uniref:Uncharacterized protein n=1 Tax=Triticum turgidum subsp. durum TaxID=4567 RepID=A0A9R0VSE5_TRITD|nr:unnamed protein product [Triticum turgidum subsp. durum]